MSELRTFGAVSLSFTACLGLVAVTACAIPLREREERAEAVVSTPVQTDPTAVRLRECRSVTPEQEDLLRECREVWSERRRIFLKDSSEYPLNTDPASKDQSEPQSIVPRAPQKGR